MRAQALERRLNPVLVASTALVAVCMFCFGLLTDDLALRMAAKPWPILALMWWAWGGSPYQRRIFGALALCLVGDMLLEVRGPMTFLLGMVAFLLGHVGYIFAMTARAKRLALSLALPFLVWIVWALSTLWPGLGAMRIPVAAYTVTIWVMMWRAASMAAHPSLKQDPWRWAALVGAVIFGLSDTLIALDRYHAALSGVRIPIILTYWIGQTLITASTLGARQPSPEDDTPAA